MVRSNISALGCPHDDEHGCIDIDLGPFVGKLIVVAGHAGSLAVRAIEQAARSTVFRGLLAGARGRVTLRPSSGPLGERHRAMRMHPQNEHRERPPPPPPRRGWGAPQADTTSTIPRRPLAEVGGQPFGDGPDPVRPILESPGHFQLFLKLLWFVEDRRLRLLHGPPPPRSARPTAPSVGPTMHRSPTGGGSISTGNSNRSATSSSRLGPDGQRLGRFAHHGRGLRAPLCSWRGDEHRRGDGAAEHQPRQPFHVAPFARRGASSARTGGNAGVLRGEQDVWAISLQVMVSASARIIPLLTTLHEIRDSTESDAGRPRSGDARRRSRRG